MDYRIKTFVCLLAMAFSTPTLGQQATSTDDVKQEKTETVEKASDSDNKQSAKKAYLALKKLVSKNNWDEAAKRMTPKGQDEFCTTLIVTATGLVKSEMPMPIPAFSDAIDEIEDAFVKHGLDKLDIDVQGTIRMTMSTGGESSESHTESDDSKTKKSNADDSHKKIVAFLNDSGKRWEIISDVFEAHQSSPIGMSVLTGQVEEVEVDGDVATLKIKMQPPESDGGGVTIQIMSPPVVIKLTKKSGEWKFDGRDVKKSAKAAAEFSENRGDHRHDF